MDHHRSQSLFVVQSCVCACHVARPQSAERLGFRIINLQKREGQISSNNSSNMTAMAESSRESFTGCSLARDTLSSFSRKFQPPEGIALIAIA